MFTLVFIAKHNFLYSVSLKTGHSCLEYVVVFNEL